MSQQHPLILILKFYGIHESLSSQFTRKKYSFWLISDISIHLKFGEHFQPAESTVLSNNTFEKGRVTDETVA